MKHRTANGLREPRIAPEAQDRRDGTRLAARVSRTLPTDATVYIWGVRFSEYHERYRRELPDRERISLDLCEKVVGEAVESRRQRDGRIQFWGYVEEEDRYLKVVLEPEAREIVTAHFDRGFKSKMRRRG